MKGYCIDCGHWLTISTSTLRCAGCEDEWFREYQERKRGERQ